MNSFHSENLLNFKFEGFFELINFLREMKDFMDRLKQYYNKNIDLLKDSLKINENMPRLEEISNWYNEMFFSK